MFLKRLIIGCAVLSMLPHAARCQSDASLEMKASKLPQLPAPGYDSLPGLVGQEGIDHIKPMLDTEDTPSTDYQNFDIDRHRPAQDSDSIESNSNVNVNVNSNIPSILPWHQPQTYRTNRLQNRQHGRNRRKKLHPIIPRIRLTPNSNFDYNFAHPNGNMRIAGKRSSRRTSSIANEKLRRRKNVDIFVPSNGVHTSICYPIIFQTIKYMKRIELNMKSIEKQLRDFLFGQGNEDNNNVQ